MTTSVLKKEINKAISNLDDEQFLQAIYTILNDRLNKEEYVFGKEEKDELDTRKANYKLGKTKVYTVAEVRKKIEVNLRK